VRGEMAAVAVAEVGEDDPADFADADGVFEEFDEVVRAARKGESGLRVVKEEWLPSRVRPR
jgi:hypothetical protein